MSFWKKPARNQNDQPSPEPDMSQQIVLELPEDSVAVSTLQSKLPGTVELVDVKHFGGEMGFVSAVVTLSAAIIPSVAKIIIEHIRAKQHIRVKVRGIEITGIDEDNAVMILSDILKKKH
jgi:hypothetical protein